MSFFFSFPILHHVAGTGFRWYGSLKANWHGVRSESESSRELGKKEALGRENGANSRWERP